MAQVTFAFSENYRSVYVSWMGRCVFDILVEI